MQRSITNFLRRRIDAAIKRKAIAQSDAEKRNDSAVVTISENISLVNLQLKQLPSLTQLT
jgi:hypothetical protein